MKRPLPLRIRLALGYSAFFVFVLALLSGGVYLAVRKALYSEIAHQLRVSSDLIQNDFDASNNAPGVYFSDPSFLIRSRAVRVEELAPPALYVQVTALDNKTITTSESMHGLRLPTTNLSSTTPTNAEPTLDTVMLSGTQVLMLARPLTDDGRAVGFLQVAEPLRDINQTLRLLLFSLSVIGLIAFLAALRGGMWLAARALQPVAQIADTAHQIVDATDLHQRVPQVAANDEIGQLTTTINQMLDRLENLFTTQQRFVADVSHELRTPLTAMRGNIEILRRGAASDPTALDETLADIEREVSRLTRLTNDLLLLAQAEAGAQIRHAPVALDELVLEIVRELRPLAGGVILKPQIATQASINGDRDRLKQALINLVVNALQHTPPGGTVALQLRTTADDQIIEPAKHTQLNDDPSPYVVLSVSDTGTGIAPADLPHVFERFYRADKARSRVAGGSGLGLAIVRWIAEAHGGTASVVSTPDNGSIFTITLPYVAP